MTVRLVELPAGVPRLVNAWRRIHANEPCWVPPLLSDRLRFLDPRRNPYFRTADVRVFEAVHGREVVGSIAATVDREFQRTEAGAGTGFFGFFEFVDDRSVAAELFDAATAWLRSRGLGHALGPFSFNANHEFGLLVHGFDEPPALGSPFTPRRYVRTYDELGLARRMDWLTYAVEGSPPVSPELERIADRLLARHPEVRIRTLDPGAWDREIETLRRLYNDAWSQNWASVPMSDEEFRWTAGGFRSILDPRMCFVVEVAGEPAAFAATLPNLNPVLQRIRGRLFPFGFWHLWRGSRLAAGHTLFVLGVAPRFQHLPLGAPLYVATWRRYRERGGRAAETTPVLETNHRMRRALERIGASVRKIYRTCGAALR